MTIAPTHIRFFVVAYTDNIESEYSGDNIDTIEITERCFKELMQQVGGIAPVQYDRNTMFDNGVDQVCLTLDLEDWPHINNLEIVQ